MRKLNTFMDGESFSIVCPRFTTNLAHDQKTSSVRSDVAWSSGPEADGGSQL
jgi:hypothetical protein